MSNPERRLCDYVAALPQRQFPDATRHRVSQALLDWFTAGRSGAGLPAAGMLHQLSTTLFPGDGAAPVFGARPAVTAIGAAFCNAGITHLREVDDAHRTAMLHPGIVAVSPTLALAAAASANAPVSNQRLTAAIVAGYEVAIRAGEAMGGEHSGLFHATATAGSLGAAAASAIMLGLNAETLHHALGLAATQAAGLWQFVDDNAHESKVLHPAFAVRNGITAAYAAQVGYPGASAFMTGKRGMHALLHANGDLASLDAGLGETDRISSSTIKPWPICGQLFTVAGATQALIDEHNPDPDQIQSVDIRIFPQALRIAKVDWPAKPVETSFSGRYCVAALLLNGRLGIRETEQPQLKDARLLALAERIRVTPEPAYAAAFPDLRPATVTIVLKDGSTLTAMRDKRQGDPELPFDWAQLDARLRAFNDDLDEADAQRISAWCEAQQHAAPEAAFTPPAVELFGCRST